MLYEPGISYIDYPTLIMISKTGEVMLLCPIFSLQVSIEGIPFAPIESCREDVQLHEPIVFLRIKSKMMRTYIAHDLLGDIIREPLLKNIDHFHLYIYIYI